MSLKTGSPGYRILDGTENIEVIGAQRRTSLMWQQVREGKRAFIEGYRPGQLGYYYRKARTEGFKVHMQSAFVDGVEGSIIERDYDLLKVDDA